MRTRCERVASAEERSRRWYLNACVAVPSAEPRSKARRDVGIDLGLEDLICHERVGRKCRPRKFYRSLEPKLAIAQRAGKKDRVRAIHAKIANRKERFRCISSRLAWFRAVRHHLCWQCKRRRAR